jgi:hypothetical protein
MKHTLILASTGVLMGCLTSLVGLPGEVELSAWISIYLLWVVYGVRVQIETPVRRMAVASTLAGLLAGSFQVLLMEQYKAHNPWYSDVFETSTAQELSTSMLGQGIAMGLVCGVVVGLLVRWRLSRTN